MRFNLPQNTIFYDENSRSAEGFYQMVPLATHIFEFTIPQDSFIKIGIAITSVDCEDLSMYGWFTKRPLDDALFYMDSGMNPFYIKKNYSYDELYAGNHGSKFTLFDKNFKFPESNILYTKLVTGSSIESEMKTYDDKHPSMTPVKDIVHESHRLLVDNNQTFFLNLRNLQNRIKNYRILFSTDGDACNAFEDLDRMPSNYRESDGSKMFSNFRYPSDNRPTY